MGSRYTEVTNAQLPERRINADDMMGYRHGGDSIAAPIVAARLQGFDPGGLAYVDVQVDASGVVQTTGAAGTQYTEDAAAVADPVGGAQILVRSDTPATLVSANGDNVARRGTNYGAAYTQLVTSTGAFIDSVGGGTEYTEDAVAAADPLGKATILVRKDTPAATVSADGDNIAQRGSNFGAGYVTILDGSGAIISSFGGGTQYTEDAAAAADPVGTAPMLVRSDTPAGLTSANGDNVAQRATNFGAAYVQVVDSSGNFVNTFGGGTQYTEDAAAAADPVGNAQILVRSDTPATLTSANGDNVALRGTNYGAAYAQIVTSTGSFVDTFGGGTQFAEDAAHTTGDVGTVAMAVRNDANTAFAGTDRDYMPLAVDQFGRQYVGPGRSVEASGSVSSATDLIVANNVDIYRMISLQLTGTWTASVQFEQSNDNTNWVSCVMNSPTTSQASNVTSAQANGLWVCGVTSRYWRARVSSYTSGTVVGTAEFSTMAAPLGNNISGARNEDAGHTTGDAGMFILGVRNDAGTSLVGTDLDYAPFQLDSSGALRVTGGAGGTSMVDDAAFTPGSTNVTPFAGTYRTVRDNLDDNDGGAVALTQKRAQLVALEDLNGDSAMDETNNSVRVSVVSDTNPGIQYVEGDADATIQGTAILWEDSADTLRTVNATNRLPVDTELPTAAALADNASNPTAPAVGAFLMGWDSANWDRVRGDGGALFGQGDLAHDAADSGNPVKIGLRAIAHGTNPTAVAAADRTNWYANRAGIPFMLGGHPNIITTEYNTTAAQTDDPIVTVATGLKIVVTRISAMVDNATTVNVGVRIGFGASTVPTEAASGANIDGIVLSHSGIAPGSGVVEGAGSGILGIGGDDADLRITNSVPTTGKLRVIVSYFTVES